MSWGVERDSLEESVSERVSQKAKGKCQREATVVGIQGEFDLSLVQFKDSNVSC